MGLLDYFVSNFIKDKMNDMLDALDEKQFLIMKDKSDKALDIAEKILKILQDLRTKIDDKTITREEVIEFFNLINDQFVSEVKKDE